MSDDNARPPADDLDKLVEQEFKLTQDEVHESEKQELTLTQTDKMSTNACEFCGKPSIKFHPTEYNTVKLPTGQDVSVSRYWCGTCTDAAERMHCKFCGEIAGGICPTCKQFFCLKDASFIDKVYCRGCLDEGKIEMKTEPIVDNEGVTHQGTHFIPIGEALKSIPRIVSEMNDTELKDFLMRCREEVRRYEKGKDFWLVQRSVAEMETKHREHRDAAKLREKGMKFSVPNGGKVVVSKTKNGGDIFAQIAKKLQEAGMTREQFAKIVEQANANAAKKK